VRITQKVAIKQISGFSEKLATLEKSLGKTGRILVRPSGTEPVIRVMVEGKEYDTINTMADELCEIVRKADAY
ncbi:MAG: phosphoglucosamine mutase, partial [Desulfobulbaceae bacterium]|nr:phosphoglucosamine mutase [Desulfobulbaceae bacterium]